jgi:peptidoglycan/xylan/chitin deacetylase (PgdA/CDA1 family)
MYHRIGIASPTASPITRRLTVAPADFAAQMRWLRRHGFHAITQHQLFAALEQTGRLAPKPIVITFDDGYRDVLDHAAPVLHRLRMPATVYVITERLIGAPDFLTPAMLRRLERLGGEIGSHTVTHAELTDLSDARALSELVRSRKALEQRLGHPVQWLAYPCGAVDDRVAALAERAGYVLAVTTRSAFDQDAQHPLELARVRVLDSTGAEGLAGLLAGVTGAR